MIICCLGMQGSGSTWVYNVVRDIHAAHATGAVALRIEELRDLEDPALHRARHVIMRAHNVSSYLLRFLQAAEARAVLSFRDPRDCVVSAMHRFNRQTVPVVNDIVRNLASLLSVRAALPHLCLTYEDGYTASVGTVSRCADFLGLPLEPSQAQAIFDRYTLAEVGRRYGAADAPNADRFINILTGSAVDRETSFHRGHITDGRIGKWCDRLPPQARDEVARLFAGCVGLPPPGALPPATFRGALFRPVDNMLAYGGPLPAAALRGPLGLKVLSDIYLQRGVWRLALRLDADMGPAVLTACQNGSVIHRMDAPAAEADFVWMNTLHDHPLDLHLAGAALDAWPDTALPPACTLSATPLWDDAPLRAGVMQTHLERPPPDPHLLADPNAATPVLKGLRARLRFHRALRRPGVLVDAGAFCGDFGLLAAADGEADVVLIEPLTEAALAVRKRAGRLAVHVIEAALAAQDGEATLHVPLQGGCPVWEWASLTDRVRDLPRDCREITGLLSIRVPARRLDSLGLPRVSAMHLSVQGAELPALQGARATLLRDRPVLSVEIEERHAPGATRRVPRYLRRLGYAGFFELDGQSQPIEAFVPARLQRSGRSPADQQYSAPYVNCFFFLPAEDADLRARFAAMYAGAARLTEAAAE